MRTSASPNTKLGAGDPRQEGTPDGPASPPFQTKGEKIRTQLEALRPGEFLYVDTTGEGVLAKDPFLKGERNGLTSFRRERDNSFTVFSGMPPVNTTHCGSFETAPPNPFSPPLRSHAVLNSASRDFVVLAGLIVPIPDRAPAIIQTQADALAKKIFKAKVGEAVTVGRLDFAASLPKDDRLGVVSRIHITATKVHHRDRGDGTADIRVVVVPGQPSKEVTSVVTRGGEVQTILGERNVKGGTTLQLGSPNQRITLPHDPDSMDYASESIRELRRNGNIEAYQHSLNTIVECTSPERYITEGAHLFRFRSGTSSALTATAKEAMKLLWDHVREGLTLIRDERFDEALDLFRDEHLLRTLGYRYEENNVIFLQKITYDDVKANLVDIASRSWFRCDDKLVYPSVGYLRNGLEPSKPEEHDLIRRWKKEYSLIVAEEYTHAIQHIIGGPVSQTADIAGIVPRYLNAPCDYEADIALFFYEQGVHLSHEFLVQRYESRDRALDKVRGPQPKEKLEPLTESILSAPFGTWVNLRGKVDVSRLTSGSYAIRPHNGWANAFVMNDQKLYVPLEGKLEVSGGERIYLRPGFKFTLP